MPKTTRPKTSNFGDRLAKLEEMILQLVDAKSTERRERTTSSSTKIDEPRVCVNKRRLDESAGGTSSPDNDNTETANSNKRTARERPMVEEVTIATSNSFEMLNPNETLSDLDPDEDYIHVPPRRPKRPPPVVLHNLPSTAIKTTTEALKTATGGNVQLRCLGKNVHVFTETKEQWTAAKEVATKAKIEYHSYTPREDRRQAWVMRGAHPDLDPKDITDELREKYQISATASVMTRMKRENGITSTVTMPLFQILIGPETPPESLLQVRSIGYFRVSWERKRGRRQVTQCHNCQRFGHGASNCGMVHRCIKCLEVHKPGECKNTNSAEPPLCVNCGEKHPANYRECPARVKYLANRTHKSPTSTLQDRLRHPRVITNPSYVQDGLPYAQAVAQQPKVDAPNVAENLHGGSIGRLTQESQNLFGMDLFTLKRKSDQFFEELEKHANRDVRKTLFLDFLSSFPAANNE